MEDNFVEFRTTDGITLQQAWGKYKEYCDEAKVPYPYSKRLFKEELKNYFRNFEERGRDADRDGQGNSCIGQGCAHLPNE